jgi:predicted acylesterase/phospholipase RssA
MLKKINQALMNEILEAQKKPIKYLVFGGGGAKGGVYTGVNAALMDCKIFSGIDSISGSSIGSMNASFLATGISRDKYYEICQTINLQSLSGDQYFINNDAKPMLALISSTINDNILEYLQTKPEMIKSKEIRKIYKKTLNHIDVTFIDLHYLQQVAPETFKGLAITAMRRVSGNLEIFDYENSPNLSIAEACCASMSIPVIFQPYKLYGVEYIDGGCKDNIPIKYFKDKDSEDRTLTFTFSADISNSKAIYSMVNPIETYSLIPSLLLYLSGTGGQSFQANAEETYQTIRKYALELLILGTANIDTLSCQEAEDGAEYLYVKGLTQLIEYLNNHDLLEKNFNLDKLYIQNLIIGVCERYLYKPYLKSKIDNLVSCVKYIRNEICPINTNNKDIGASEILLFAKNHYWDGKDANEVLINFIKKALTKEDGNLSINTKLLGNLISTLNDPYSPSILKGQVAFIIESEKIDPNSETIERDLIELTFEPQDFIKFSQDNQEIELINIDKESEEILIM